MDDPFAAAFAPRCWSRVDADDLVFLVPTLAHPSHRGRALLSALVRDAALRVEERGATARLAAVLARAQAGLLGAETPLGERDGALVAFACRINPAYLDPALACLHETGALCAWLGLLADGRDALLPVCLADPLAEAAGPRRENRAPGDGLPAAAADLAHAVGARRLSAAAAHGRAHGVPVRVRRSRCATRTLAAAVSGEAPRI